MLLHALQLITVLPYFNEVPIPSQTKALLVNLNWINKFDVLNPFSYMKEGAIYTNIIQDLFTLIVVAIALFVAFIVLLFLKTWFKWRQNELR